MKTCDMPEIDLEENAYGHRKRVEWIVAQLKKTDRIVELGCGTGIMITRTLCKLGYDARGVDLDETSVEFGQKQFELEGLDPHRLQTIDLADSGLEADVIVASEVLEHIRDDHQTAVFEAIDRVLRPGGLLLVTVPNGYGWFEFDRFLYFDAGLGWLIERSRLLALIHRFQRACGITSMDSPPSTLADSPHVQWFTRRKIRNLLRRFDYRIEQEGQTVLFSGPMSNLLITGWRPLMFFNRILGDLFPWFAAGFLLVCRKEPSEDGS